MTAPLDLDAISKRADAIGPESVSWKCPRAVADITALVSEVRQLREALARADEDVIRLTAEAKEDNDLMRQSAEMWESLQASANNVCGHCRVPVSQADMPAHIRGCDKNPMVAEMARLRALLGEARTELFKSAHCDARSTDGIVCRLHLGHRGNHETERGALISWPDSERKKESRPPSLLARIDAALGTVKP